MYLYMPNNDKDPLDNLATIVWIKSFCSDCCNSCCKGENKRFLKNRIKEHKSNIKLHVDKQVVVYKKKIPNIILIGNILDVDT